MKRRCCETLVLIVLVLGLSSFMAREQGSVYHVAVDGLSKGMTEEEVVAMKGEGRPISNGRSYHTMVNGDGWVYTRVYFDQDHRVKAIYSSHSLVLNGNNEVRKGTSWRELRASLGRPDKVFRLGDDSEKIPKRIYPSEKMYVYRELDLGVYCKGDRVSHFQIFEDVTKSRYWMYGKGGWYVW